MWDRLLSIPVQMASAPRQPSLSAWGSRTKVQANSVCKFGASRRLKTEATGSRVTGSPIRYFQSHFCSSIPQSSWSLGRKRRPLETPTATEQLPQSPRSSKDSRGWGGAKLRVRVPVTPTHEHAGPAHNPAGPVSGGRGDRVRRWNCGYLRVARCPWPRPVVFPGSRQNASFGKHGALSRVPSVHLAVSIWRGIVKFCFPDPGGKRFRGLVTCFFFRVCLGWGAIDHLLRCDSGYCRSTPLF